MATIMINRIEAIKDSLEMTIGNTIAIKVVDSNRHINQRINPKIHIKITSSIKMIHTEGAEMLAAEEANTDREEAVAKTTEAAVMVVIIIKAVIVGVAEGSIRLLAEVEDTATTINVKVQMMVIIITQHQTP